MLNCFIAIEINISYYRKDLSFCGIFVKITSENE